MKGKALILVDVQNDFCPGGSLAVPNGHEVVPPLNRMIAFAVRHRWDIFASRDWHPRQTKHFAEFGGIWPVHCVQGTRGAEFHPDLRLPNGYVRFQVISKGLGDADDYSAFDGGMRPEAEHLYVGGLATDYCVLSTVRAAIEHGHKVTLLTDACRAVNLKDGDGERAIEEMRAIGAMFATVEDVLREPATI
ncbi:MAG: isochorismatase family protein [Parcubacteria group bacterium]|nr:isochorismatase family protein [Parcubacteria group bacterium]